MVVSNFVGSVTSAPAMLTVNPVPPAITTPPMSQTVNAWQDVNFAVVATGPFLTYQWRKDGVDLAGATSATYSVPFAQTNHAGNYTVVVSNPVGSVTSAPPAVLTVNAAASGVVVVWGASAPVPIAAQSGVVAIAAGEEHIVALKMDGSVVAWRISFQMTVPVAAQSGVTAIAAGGYHTVALKNDGSVVAWGDDDYGQITVPTAAQSGVTAIAAGGFRTVALKTDGSVIAWGYNSFGQTTVPVAAQSGVTALAAGGYHIVALKTDGSVVAWGYNLDGQTTVPEGLSGVAAIAAGTLHTVALLGSVPLLPSLKAQPSGNQLILTWPTNAPGFTLQTATNLSLPMPWLDVPGSPAVVNGRFTVTNALSGPARFYRIKK